LFGGESLTGVKFPLRFDKEFNKSINDIIEELNKYKNEDDKRISKHQFCLDAIAEKMEREKVKRSIS